MDIDHFILLDDTEKEEIISEEGVFVLNYSKGDHMFDVYFLFDFIVSFCYDLPNNVLLLIVAHTYHGNAIIYPQPPLRKSAQ